MLLTTLPFGELREIEPNIVEATVFEGIELDRGKIDLALAALNETYRAPYAVLSNRVYRYSHTHESMTALAEAPNLRGMAVLVYNPISNVAAGIHELYQDNVRVFHIREAALDWLRGLFRGEADVAGGQPDQGE